MHKPLSRLSPGVWSVFAASNSCTLAAVQHAMRRGASSGANGGQEEEFDVVIALGTNMGNRGLNLHRGLRRLRQLGLTVLRHSALYETAAAYVTDQPAFLNAALLARTRLPPRELLRLLKQVEAEAGRDLAGGLRFGPRPLDLDIVFYGAVGYRDERLEVPHPRWRERPFVTAPVADLLYRRDAASASSSSSSSTSSSNSNGGGGCSNLTAAARGAGAASTSGRPGSSAPLPQGHAGSVLGHLRDVRGVWDALCSSRGKQAPPAGPQPGANSGGGSSGGGGGSSGGGGGEVMRRVTPLINMDVGPSATGATSSGSSSGSSSSSSSSSNSGSSSDSSGSDALLTWGVRTQLMAILNVTPDSFSDGGKFFPAGLAGGSSSRGDGSSTSGDAAGLAAVVAAAEAMVREGADMLDVGGQSTRPGATRLSPEEELARVMPVVRALRQSPALRSVPISVDTFYARVARETVAAGANIVNDVSGGTLDPDMRDTVAELGVPYVLMHMRGDPGTMTRPEHTSYVGPVWRGVGAELLAAAEAAEAAGVAAWSIILDPGIGFAKTAEGNVQLLRDLPLLRGRGLDGPYAASAAAACGSSSSSPEADDDVGSSSGGCGSSSRVWGGPLLVGPSRKRFLGALTGREVASERDAATAAACVVSVAAGADVVRVHNVRDVRDALRVADAVYRG